jgi:hypothetical protein
MSPPASPAAPTTKPIVAMTPIITRGDFVGDKNKNGETPQDYRNAIAKVCHIARRKRERRSLRNRSKNQAL